MNESRKTPSRIVPARGDADLALVAALFREYRAMLGDHVPVPEFDGELAGLPGEYGPPSGEILLAKTTGSGALGCVALRTLPGDPSCGEIKRLFLRPSARGTGIGRRLMEEILAVARARGFREIKLDTLPTLIEAVGLYRALGFERIERYNDNPVAGLLYFRLRLE